MRSLISVALWTCVFLLRQNCVDAVECKEMNIGFHSILLHQLTNCTSILGSLAVHSMTDHMVGPPISDFQFPLLKEITGYLLIYGVNGLTSVGQLFPNLSVIRGRQLALWFALIIFNNLDMTTVDLKSLVSIQRGYVLIEQCPLLCYHNTIAWEAITEEDEDTVKVGKGNVIQAAQRYCPTKESCRSCENNQCWSSYSCQRNKNYFKNLTEGVICHESCLGGCVNSTSSGCHVCTKLSVNGKCVDECPSDLFLFRETMRCITKQKCVKQFLRRHTLIPFNGECREWCPVSYSQYHPVTNEFDKFNCFECAIKCVRRCNGTAIRGPSDLDNYRECTIVEGSMRINLGSNMADINEKLVETLGNIETINGALTILRSFTLTSLAFFRNLNRINAVNVTSKRKINDEQYDEYHNPYALEIYENDNLQTLFNWKEKQHFEITGGGIFIHYNSKLCMDEVHSLRNIIDYDRTYDSIGYNTNGYDETCHATGIYTFHDASSYNSVKIYWNISDFGLNRRLIGYFVYYIEAPSQNITYFSGLDACSPKKVRSSSTDLPMISQRNYSDVWQSVLVPLEDLTMVKGYYVMSVTGLKQYTQYAYYIRTQLSLKVKDQLINVTQGQSQVKYFRTLADQPRPPIVRTKDKTNVSITLEWIPSTPEDELVHRYYIDVYELIEDVKEFDERDYCLNPMEAEEIVPKDPEVICCNDQRAYLEFFRREEDQTCGDRDLNCEKTFEFVLFHHHVERALLEVDAQKDPSRRHSIYSKRVSYEAPDHHEIGTTDPIKLKNESDINRFYLHSHIIDDKYMDSIIVPNLKPFHLYAFYVYACNKVSNCSDYYFYSDRTEPMPGTDDAILISIQDEDHSENVKLVTNPPPDPWLVVAYEIESCDTVRGINVTTCFTRKQMEEMQYEFRVENMLEGMHWFRIRTLSIGANGLFSNWNIVLVDAPPTYSIYWYGISLALGSIATIIVGIFSYKKFKKRPNRQVRDNDYLLSERNSSDTDDQSGTVWIGPERYELKEISPNPTAAYNNRTNRVAFSGTSKLDHLVSRTTNYKLRKMKKLMKPDQFKWKESPRKNESQIVDPSLSVAQGSGLQDLLMTPSLLSRSHDTESEDALANKHLLSESPKASAADDSDGYDYSLFD